jgi:hypothetical protein
LVKDENVDVLPDSYNILIKWRNYFCQVLNVHGVNDDRQAERHTAEPLIAEPSYFEEEIAIEKI